MGYFEYKPGGALAHFIEVIWILESADGKDVLPNERILPDGIVEIIFHFGRPFITTCNGNRFVQPRSFAISTMHKFIELQPQGETGFVAVRFYPWGAHHFFKTPVKDFLDFSIDTGHLWKNHHELEETINLAANNQQRVKAVEDFLLRQLHKNYRSDAIDKVVQLIRGTKGQLSIDDICRQTGYTQRHLARKFNASVGASPKAFSRLTRFLNICSHLKAYSHKTLSELTYECGYYDQAHFIKEFREFSGLTPTDFFARQDVSFLEI